MESLAAGAHIWAMKRKTLPAQNVLTNKRDNESDLGGVRLVDQPRDDDPDRRPAVRETDRPQVR